jgi:hypothetical protein
MARGYRLTFAREPLDLGELAELFSILDELYVLATAASAGPREWFNGYPDGSQPVLVRRPYVGRVSKQSPWVVELIQVAEEYGPYGVGLALLIAILRNPEEIGRFPFRVAEGWLEGLINVRTLRRKLHQLGREANELAGPITAEEFEAEDPERPEGPADGEEGTTDIDK